MLVPSFSLALWAVTGLLLSLTLLTAAHKTLRTARDRRRARIEAIVRPSLLALLAEDDPDPADLELSGRSAGDSLEALATGLLTKLRGEDRRVLERLLAVHGVLERARRRTRRPGPVGRARAAELLGAAGYAEARPELELLLSDREPSVRATAARALGKLGDPAAIPALFTALESRHGVPAGVVTMSLLHIGPGAAPALEQGLRTSQSATVRSIAAELLGRLGSLSAADDLIGALRADPAAAVRAAAARALGRLGAPRAVAPLEAALIEEHEPAVRQATAWALGELGDSRGFAGLAAALRSGEHALARRAADALAACGPSGLALLRRTAATTGAGAPEARETLATMEVSR